MNSDQEWELLAPLIRPVALGRPRVEDRKGHQPTGPQDPDADLLAYLAGTLRTVKDGLHPLAALP
jgi:hypothetical protein